MLWLYLHANWRVFQQWDLIIYTVRDCQDGHKQVFGLFFLHHLFQGTPHELACARSLAMAMLFGLLGQLTIWIEDFGFWMASAPSISQAHFIYCSECCICKLFYLPFYSANSLHYSISLKANCPKQNASKNTTNFRSGSMA